MGFRSLLVFSLSGFLAFLFRSLADSSGRAVSLVDNDIALSALVLGVVFSKDKFGLEND